MTPQQAFRQWCRMMRDAERQYKRGDPEAGEACISDYHGLHGAMGERERMLALELMDRLDGQRHYDMFPEHRRQA